MNQISAMMEQMARIKIGGRFTVEHYRLTDEARNARQEHPNLLKLARNPVSRILVPKKYLERMSERRLIGIDHTRNIVVNEGLNHTLSVLVAGGTQVNPWSIGLFEGNYTPVATDTAANITANSTECVAYDEATRQTYVEAAPSGQSVTNSANKATFTMNAPKTVYGAFLVSLSTKSGTTGTLLAASRFSASRNVVDNDQLLVTYTLAAADA